MDVALEPVVSRFSKMKSEQLESLTSERRDKSPLSMKNSVTSTQKEEALCCTTRLTRI
jgi:hypothetical protein